MSEEQKEYLAEYDRRYLQMKHFLLTIIGIVLAAFLATGAVNIGLVSSNQNRSINNKEDIAYIMDNSASIQAIDRLIMTFENQTSVMEKYLPDDVRGAISEFNKKSAELRSNIMMFNSSIKNRSVESK